MKTIRQHRFVRLGMLACAIGMFICGTNLRAADQKDQAAPPPKGHMEKVGSVSAASLDRLQGVARKIGVDLPPFLTASGLEEQFSFLGKGGLEGDKPVGVVFFAGPNLNVEKGQGIVFIFPVKPGAAPLAAFKDAGGKPLANDAVLLNGVAFKRTADEFMFSPTPAAALAVREGELARVYQDHAPADNAHPLLDVRMDIKAMRTAAPESYQKFIDQMDVGYKPKDDYERYGHDLGVSFVKQLTRVHLSLLETAGNLELKLGIAPATVPQPGSFAQPGMPKHVAVRVDLATAPLNWIPSLDPYLDEMLQKVPADKNKPFTPHERQQLRKMFNASTDVLLDGKALSIGVAPQQKDAFIVYLVQQQATPGLEGRLQKFVDELNATAHLDTPGEAFTATMEHYADGDRQITRLAGSEPGHPTLYLDALEKDGSVYMSISIDPRHLVPELAAEPAGKPMHGLLSGQVDLKKALEMAENSSDSPLAKLSPDQRKKVARLFETGRTLEFSASGESDGIVFSVALPQDLVKQVVNLIQSGG